ncbi:MAG: (Fe-S)-binding protein [Acidimicrobiia bacterium]|nr:(Fe-S)-binding protein [Acidimicrobiia bacterium]
MGWVTAQHPKPADLASCVQCGLCLPVCPTFRLTGRETASPRGRIQAMNAVNDSVVAVESKLEEMIDFCLGCRACEPVCPSLVPYGRLLEGARAEVVAQRPTWGTRIRGLILGRLIGVRSVLSVATAVVSLIQRWRLHWLVPGFARRSVSGVRPLRARPSSPQGDPAASVALLTGCVQGQWFRGVNQAAVTLLARAGIAVAIPPDQTCCGALAAHDGHADAADRLAAVNEKAFAGFDRVFATAAGCSAHLVDLDPQRAVDVTVLVAEAIDAGLLPSLDVSLGPVVVQDPCHLRHAQRVTEEPRRILRAAGYALVELGDGGMCCGAAGLYTVLQPETSAALGEKKAELVRSTGHDLVASANPGCEMQLRSHLGNDYRVAHPIELYLEALDGAAGTTIVPDVEAAID